MINLRCVRGDPDELSLIQKLVELDLQYISGTTAESEVILSRTAII
jgi:hypothetical protein